MDFSDALRLLKEGKFITRGGWAACSGTFLYLVDGSKVKVNRPPLNNLLEEGTQVQYLPHIDVGCDDNVFKTWSPTNEDLLAEDWQELV